ncbi:MAG: hypothetical protein AAFO94_06495 [Bacteroidota bacterium]
MKTLLRSTALLCLLLCFGGDSASAQTIAEKLGGTYTNFLITSADSVLINDSQQLLIRRAQYSFDTYSEGIGGYGYMPFTLEIITDRAVVRDTPQRRNHRKYLVRFFDANEKLLHNHLLEWQQVRIVWQENNRRLYAYLLNLETIPISLLDQTVRIDILNIYRL